jgi:hypothetical protein
VVGVVGRAEVVDWLGLGVPVVLTGPVVSLGREVVSTPAGEVPRPTDPGPPALVEAPGPASSATAANAVATTSPATPTTTQPPRPGRVLEPLGGATEILVLDDPAGRDISAPRGDSVARLEVKDHALAPGRGIPGRMTSAGRLSP